MNKFLIAAAAACVALVSANVAHAEPIEEKNLEKGKDTIKPDMGYIYLHGPSRMQGVFLKVPSEEDKRQYEQDWEEEYLEAREKYEKKLERYENMVKSAKKLGKRPPEAPEEVNRESFGIDPIELRNNSSFGPMYIFSKDKTGAQDMFSYMNEVEPGTYVYYGPLFVNPNGGGFFGTCYCMGSVQFDVEPGTVTNLGDMLIKVALSVPPPSLEEGGSVMPGAGEVFTLDGVDFTLPASLQQYPGKMADFRASGKYDNYYGVTIDRMPPIEGVLAYNRDIPLDMKADLDDVDESSAALQQAADGKDATVNAIQAGTDADGEASDAEYSEVPATAETSSESAVAETAKPE